LAEGGADVVVIDQEHGAIGPKNLHAPDVPPIRSAVWI
jgi:hypothetical protein